MHAWCMHSAPAVSDWVRGVSITAASWLGFHFSVHVEKSGLSDWVQELGSSYTKNLENKRLACCYHEQHARGNNRGNWQIKSHTAVLFHNTRNCHMENSLPLFSQEAFILKFSSHFYKESSPLWAVLQRFEIQGCDAARWSRHASAITQQTCTQSETVGGVLTGFEHAFSKTPRFRFPSCPFCERAQMLTGLW